MKSILSAVVFSAVALSGTANATWPSDVNALAGQDAEVSKDIVSESARHPHCGYKWRPRLSGMNCK